MLIMRSRGSPTKHSGLVTNDVVDDYDDTSSFIRAREEAKKREECGERKAPSNKSKGKLGTPNELSGDKVVQSELGTEREQPGKKKNETTRR